MSEVEPALARALHRARSTLARVQAEAELLELDGVAVGAVLEGLREAFGYLAAAEDASVDDVRTNTNPRTGPEKDKPLVVLIEDDDRLGALLARQLHRAGVPTVTTPSPAVGLICPREAVLVVDLSTVGELAPHQLTSLRDRQPIVLTGAVGASARAKAQAIGARGVLLKPVQIEDLVKAIREALGARES